MKTTARVIELGLTIGALTYAGFITRKWVQAERRAEWLAGQWSVYQSFAETKPGDLKKW